MRPRQLAGLILASALVTFDGTATTVALPAIGRDLSTTVWGLQWIGNAPLLVMAALLLPAGTLVDRIGPTRVLRAGLISFSVSAILCAAAPSLAVLIGARLGLGAAGALLLPASLASLRNKFGTSTERARIFGVWAAWIGVASVVGPLLSAVLVQHVSWRSIFAVSILGGVVALALIGREAVVPRASRRERLPLMAAGALTLLLGAVAYLLSQAAAGGIDGTRLTAVLGVAAVAVLPLTRSSHRDLLLPGELLRAHNCVPANVATFGLYFGLFGTSFVIALYTQQVLDYSAFRAAIALLPLSAMLVLSEPFGRVAARIGARTLVIAGVITAVAGVSWIAVGPQPLGLWSHLCVGTGLFGLGTSMAVSALTHAAVAAVPETCAGVASGLNHAIVRAAGLVAIALLGAIAAPGFSEVVSEDGFRRSMVTCACVVATLGVSGSLWLRDEEPGGFLRQAQAEV